jgi:trans-2,3-dihydro-3-hydroxyanthranilate isomerase
MSDYPFYIVDVFAESTYAGNQLAVFRNASSLSDEQMQHFANEMHFSETTFILSEEMKDGGYDVRIFTPAVEVPFAGHPTLGTAFIIQKEIAKDQPQQVILNLKVGRIPVTFEIDSSGAEILWMNQKTPSFGSILSAAAIAEALNLQETDIDKRFPIQEVSTGLPFIILPLKSIAAVKQASVLTDKFFVLVESLEAKAILIFSPEVEHPEHALHVRVFAHGYGVPEDPATGSANGCLAAYLSKVQYFGKPDIDISVEQGYEIGRPSLLYLRTSIDDGKINVFVGGKVQFVAEGKFV